MRCKLLNINIIPKILLILFVLFRNIYAILIPLGWNLLGFDLENNKRVRERIPIFRL